MPPTLITIVAVAITAVGGVFASKIAASGETSEKLNDYKLEQQKVDSVQDLSIGQLKTSACVQNDNMRNIAAAVRATFVHDPNCK